MTRLRVLIFERRHSKTDLTFVIGKTQISLPSLGSQGLNASSCELMHRSKVSLLTQIVILQILLRPASSWLLWARVLKTQFLISERLTKFSYLSYLINQNWASSWDYGTFRYHWTHSLNAHAQPSGWARCLIFVGPFVYFHTSCVRTAKALARLRGCAGSPEPSLVAYVISTIISWAASNDCHL